MKKIGKKLTNFTKVFLVFCLLFSNLSSLKIVFAYEGEEDIGENKVEEVLEEKEEEILEEEEEPEEITEDTELDEEEIVENKEEILEEEEIEEEEKEETEEIVEGKREVPSEEENEENNEEENKEVEATSEETTEGETTEETSEEETVIDYTSALNDSASSLGLDGTYLFVEVDGNKKLRVIEGTSDTEINDIVSNAFPDATVTVDGSSVTITNGEETITYEFVIYDSEYLLRLMKVAIGDGEAEDDDDVNGDGTVDAYDAATLRLMLSYGFGSEVIKQDVTIDAKLDGKTDSLTVGDTFKIQYIMTLADYGVDGVTGLINYNKDMLTLDNVEVKNFADGSDYNGKFLYFGDYIMGDEVVTEDDDGNEVITYSPKDYIIIEMTFTATSGGSDAVSISNIGYFNESIYYSGNGTISKDVTITSNDNTLSSLTIGGVSVPIDRLTDVYTITVPNDVTSVDLSYILSDSSARVTSIVAPEELAIGENTVTITVVAENGEERTYTITVIREGEEEEEEETEVVNPVNYEDDTYVEEDTTKKEEITTDGLEEKEEEKKDDGKLSRVIIVILILLAIAGLIYLIFKDDDDDETKKVNKDIDKLKKEDIGETKKSEAKTKKVNNNKKTNKKGR